MESVNIPVNGTPTLHKTIVKTEQLEPQPGYRAAARLYSAKGGRYVVAVPNVGPYEWLIEALDEDDEKEMVRAAFKKP